jgi:hypothetical protein
MYYVQFFCDKRQIYSDFPLTPYRPEFFLKYDVQKVLHEHEINEHLSNFQGFRYHGWYVISEIKDGAGEVGETLLIFLKKDYKRAAEICTNIFTQVFEFEPKDFSQLKTDIGSWNDESSLSEKLARWYNSFIKEKHFSTKPLQRDVTEDEVVSEVKEIPSTRKYHPIIKLAAILFLLSYSIIGFASFILLMLGSNSEGTPTQLGTIGLIGLCISMTILFGGSLVIAVLEKVNSSKSQIREILLSIKVAFNQKLEWLRNKMAKLK